MKTSTLILAAGALLALPSCGEDAGPADGNDGGPGGKADDVDDLDPSEFACAGAFEDASERSDKGQVSDLQRLDGLNDPFARAVLKATANGCPTDMRGIVEKMTITEGTGCSNESAIVSEDGQFKNEDGSFLVDDPGYRVVSGRGCSGENSRPRWHVQFSSFSASPGSMGSPPEVIAFDQEQGVFNYYVAGSGGYEWHGNSIDAATNNGNRCGNCHNNGSIIQKELDSPWLHWEHSTGMDIAGTPDFYDKFGKMTVEVDGAEQEVNLMGDRKRHDGASVERDVENAAEVYAAEGFIPHLLGEKGNGGVQVAELLEPLFCTQEINLQSGGSRGKGGVTFRTDFFLAREFSDADFNGGVSALSASGSLSLSEEQYDAAIARSGQRVAALGTTDTWTRLTYPERSFQDGVITQQLLKRGILDADIVSDVLMIDFTRPLFSEVRCGLLEEAARNGAFEGMESADDVTAQAVRDGLIKALADSEAEGAARLVAALENPDDNADQEAARNDFIAACNARLEAEGDTFIDELMRVSSNVRQDAIEKPPIDPRGPHHIIESKAIMVATDDLPHDGSFFNEQCCIGECAAGPGGDDDDDDDDTPPDPDPMGDGAGNCCDAAPEDAQRPGCENTEIESCVCGEDEFCCETNFDDICVGIAKDTCGAEC